MTKQTAKQWQNPVAESGGGDSHGSAAALEESLFAADRSGTKVSPSVIVTVGSARPHGKTLLWPPTPQKALRLPMMELCLLGAFGLECSALQHTCVCWFQFEIWNMN